MTGARPLGIVGFGRLARDYYLPAMRALGRGRFAVADPSAESREAARRAGAVAAYDSPEALLDGEALEGVLVASPPSTHWAAWRAAAGRGVAVFMEKPFPLPQDLARIDPADPACRLVMLDFNRRFWPAYRRAGALLRAGRIGRPLRARFTLQSDVRAWSTVGRHRLDPAEGGVLNDLGSHVLDLAAITFPGRPATIEARRAAPGGAADAVSIRLAYPDGLLVDCELAYAVRNRERVLIEGERGRLRLEEPNGALWYETRESPARRLVTQGVDLALLASRALIRDRSMLRASVRAALAAFLAGIETGGPFSPGFADAWRVARWIGAATRSLTAGRPEPAPD